MHDVDENETTIARLGGRWSDNIGTGVTLRQMYDSSSYTANTVASVCSFECECVYIISLIVNELIGDNSVKESIVHLKETKVKKTIVIQVLIFVSAWFVMTPDALEDNTWGFGLFGSYDLVRGNAHWVLLGAAVLSVINIWLWWPKARRTVEKPIAAESTKSAEAANAIDRDPKTPDLN